MSVPVTYRLSSEARKTQTPAISSGNAGRPRQVATRAMRASGQVPAVLFGHGYAQLIAVPRSPRPRQLVPIFASFA